MNLLATTVGILQCRQYGHDILAQSLQRMLEVCHGGGNLRSARVVIKPNLISARRGPLACTDARFIIAAAKLFRDNGARVVVGDSPAFGSAEGILKKIGAFQSLQKMAVPIVDFSRAEPVILPSGLRAGLAADAMNCDLLVNLPRVKAHIQLRITLAVKNYFGCLAGIRKPFWHMRFGGKEGSFEHHVVELLSLLPDSITFVDGITAMHKTGPLSGDPYELGIVACSTNPVAVDTALLSIIGLEPGASPLMRACLNAGIAGTDLAALTFPFLHPLEAEVHDFEVPDKLSPIRFSPVRFLSSSVRRFIMQFNATC